MSIVNVERGKTKSIRVRLIGESSSPLKTELPNAESKQPRRGAKPTKGDDKIVKMQWVGEDSLAHDITVPRLPTPDSQPSKRRRTKRKEEKSPPTPIATLELGPHGPRQGVAIEAVREMIMDENLEILFVIGPQGSGKTTLAERIKEDINASDTVDKNGQEIFSRHIAYDTYRERKLAEPGKEDRNSWTAEDSQDIEDAFLHDVLHFLNPSPSNPNRKTKMRRKVVLDATAFDDGTVSRGLDTLIALIQERGVNAVRVLALVPNPEILEEAIRSRLAAADAREFKFMLQNDGVAIQRPVTGRRGRAKDEERLRLQMLHSGFAETTMTRLTDWFSRIKTELEQRGVRWENMQELFQLPEFLQSLNEGEIVAFMKKIGGSVDNVIQAFAYFFKNIFPGKIQLPEERVTVAILEKSDRITRVPTAA